jgi:hypothetical protein
MTRISQCVIKKFPGLHNVALLMSKISQCTNLTEAVVIYLCDVANGQDYTMSRGQWLELNNVQLLMDMIAEVRYFTVYCC